MEEACRRGLAGGLDFPEKGYKEKMAWGTRAKCSTVRWPTQRAAMTDAPHCLIRPKTQQRGGLRRRAGCTAVST